MLKDKWDLKYSIRYIVQDKELLIYHIGEHSLDLGQSEISYYFPCTSA